MRVGVTQGSLFTDDFLRESIVSMPDWAAIPDAAVATFRSDLLDAFARFPTGAGPNESQTEDDLIWPVLGHLGWTSSLRQQNLSARGREDVPDGILFKDDAAKAGANRFPEEWKRYQVGLAAVEVKRWKRPLDRRSGRRGEETAPSTQMLRYLRRVDDVSEGSLRWGILTNGAQWRLYYAGARSVSEQFCEIDLAAVLAIPGHEGGLFAISEDDRRHWLKVFLLVFGRDGFLPTPSDDRTFHQRALEEGRFYEERVAADLSGLVFGYVFPELAKAIAAAAPAAPLNDVRDAALIVLYRLLFIFYAEDRDLLPVRDSRYDDYGLRERVRGDIGRRKDQRDAFSASAARYWSAFDDLCRAIDQGDGSIGLPPYNGGLFDANAAPLLGAIRISDAVMANLIDALSFRWGPTERKYINYRDLSVQQLGSIYERLLEHEVVRDGGEISVRPNIFARKGSGSYYTPDDLVGLIIRETVAPLVSSRAAAFEARAKDLHPGQPEDQRIGALKRHDPAERLLELKICDPAMGSGHFLVSLVDYLADEVIAAMAEAEATAKSEASVSDYVSPLSDRIDAIRNTILGNAEARGWTVDPAQLDDRHIIRRMVLKRCVYGVDKNPMAVELAKVALWLHTFTVGAPLSFLDHHLRCGDSLFGLWVGRGIEKVAAYGTPLFLHEPMRRAMRAASAMQIIEGLTDAEIAEAHRSADIYDEVREMTAALDSVLSLIQAFDWLDLRSRDDTVALQAFFIGQFGDPIDIATGRAEPLLPEGSRAEAARNLERFAEILVEARQLVVEERFLNWQVAFPGVWSNWESGELSGGFDAVIGNPPWDRMKLQQVEWFAVRRREIALAQRASDRKRMINALEAASDPLAVDFAKAAARAEAAFRVARTSGDYPLLSGGDLNIYSLFVERAMTLAMPSGMIGLLTPSGIASDKNAASFFRGVATEGRLRALFDFENGKVFFPDVHASFKFCVFVASPSPLSSPARCAFYLHSIAELDDPDRCFELSSQAFALVNPNTGTAPIFRSRRDADLTTAIYSRLPILANRSRGGEVKEWPVTYLRMFDMTIDSGLFRNQHELEEQDGAYKVSGNRYRGRNRDYLPLYEGKMVQAFDHRAASVVINPRNQHRPASPAAAVPEQHRDPNWTPSPQYWIGRSNLPASLRFSWCLTYKLITATTNARTMIAAALPEAGVGNSLGVLVPAEGADHFEAIAPGILANLNSVVFDFVIRQKIQGQNINWYMVEQLPVASLSSYRRRFGTKTAGEIIHDAVLELTYTAHDMAPFARALGHVDETDNIKPPFPWDEARRLRLRAKLDAVYFHLYNVTDRDDVRYIYSTFPIVENEEQAAYGSYRSLDLCLAWMNALAAGHPDADIQ